MAKLGGIACRTMCFLEKESVLNGSDGTSRPEMIRGRGLFCFSSFTNETDHMSQIQPCTVNSKWFLSFPRGPHQPILTLHPLPKDAPFISELAIRKVMELSVKAGPSVNNFPICLRRRFGRWT